MLLKAVDTVDSISPEEFKKKYFEPQVPLVIKDLSKKWDAHKKWNWDYLKKNLGNTKVGIYNNIKSDPYTPINKADEYTTFDKYIDMVSKGPAEWRIFLFNIFNYAPQLTKDFTWPEHLMKGFIKRVPMLFVGGKGSVTHMHFDMDISHLLHTQFMGSKRVLLFPFKEQYKLYRKPFEVLSLVDFTNYYDKKKSKIDYKKFPALKAAEGYDLTLNHGDTLFMPAGYWHHMEYLQSGFAMSLRALQSSLSGKLHGAWSLVGMRNIDTLLKKTIPKPWYEWKVKKIYEYASKSEVQIKQPFTKFTSIKNAVLEKEPEMV
jgi:hypothetical protein